MKKAISLLLVLVMCLALCACGSKEKVKKELIQKPWSYEEYEYDSSFKTLEVTSYNFSNSGTVGYYHSVDCYFSFGGLSNIAKEKKNGTYTIEKNEIIISYDDGNDTILKYEYNNGELKIYQELFDGTVIYFTTSTFTTSTGS